ncbi:hypothetical protein LJC27_02595 [Christensenellaceae bacterium OttesenSCG-928-M15]|nr:hypothetical protein [Christensenellaceae bacterium OttesenSCG-928-M15]
MTPCEMNAMVTAISNYLYTSLSNEDFKCLSIILNELSKTMFTMNVYQGICGVRRNDEAIEIAEDAAALE